MVKLMSVKKSARRSKVRQSKRGSGQDSLQFENLEDRQLLAFDFLFDGATLTLNQTVDDGVIQIDNSGPLNEFRVSDGGGFVSYEAADNVVVNLLDNSGNMTVSLNEVHSGDFTVNAGDGNRTVLFASPGNDLGGVLTFNAAAGEQVLSLTQLSGMESTGLEVDTGSGSDALQLMQPLVVHGDMNLRGVNIVDVDDQLIVDGDVLVDNSNEEEVSRFSKLNVAPSTVDGRFTYLGSNELDQLRLREFVIGGDVNVDHGRGISGAADFQLLDIIQSEFNNLTFTSGDTTQMEFFSLDQVLAHGDINIDMGQGENIATLDGFTEGANVSYSGLDGTDALVYQLGAAGVSVQASMGDGNDQFALDGSSLVDLEIDFGRGDDTFQNFGSDFSYDARLINLDGLDVQYESGTDALTFTQRADAIIVSLELRSDPFSDRFLYAGNDVTTASNLNVMMGDNNLGSLDLYLEHQLTGDMNVDLGHGPRKVDLAGAVNEVDGDFQLIAGDDKQEIFLDTVAAFSVGGETLIDLGRGEDLIEVANGVSFNEDVYLVNVNEVALNGSFGTKNDLVLDVSNDSAGLLFSVQQQLQINGDMTLVGNDLFAERLRMTPAVVSEINGHVLADFGGNQAAVNDQFIILAPTMDLFGGVEMYSTSDTKSDFFRSDLNSRILGDIHVELGDGTNIGNFGHQVEGGDLLRFVSGSGNDEVFLRTDGLPMTYNFSMGAGHDTVTLEAGTVIGDMLRIDFGGGNDNFVNNKGNYDWDMRLLNFHGFNNFYDPETDSVRIVQIEDTQNFAVSNDGFANSIQVDLQDGSGYELTPVTHLQVNLMANSTNDMGLDLNTGTGGDVTLNLSHGDREVYFVGTNNSIGGDLRVVAGDGQQDLYLADNHDLTVYGETVINLRDGADSIHDGGNQLHFDSSLFLRNVDNFEVSNSLFVGGNMNMVSHWYTQDVLLDNDGSIQVDGKFTYLGSDGVDKLLLGGNVLIGDDFFALLGENNSSVSGQVVDVSNGFEAAGRFGIQAGTANGGNIFISDGTTRIGGDAVIDFTESATSNTAVIRCNFGGTYGTFRGGSASDSLQFDAVAEDMHWASLMHDGDDEVTLGTSANVLFKYIDFAFGDDLFDDQHVEEFPILTMNLP